MLNLWFSYGYGESFSEGTYKSVNELFTWRLVLFVMGNSGKIENDDSSLRSGITICDVSRLINLFWLIFDLVVSND